VTNTPVSPDAVALWPGVVGEFALDFDQRGPGYPRRSGRAMDVGAVEFQASITALSFVLIDDAPAGMRLHLQGAPNETLSIQWNAQPGPGGWQPLTSGVTDVTGQLEYTDTSTVGQPQRFYRAVR